MNANKTSTATREEIAAVARKMGFGVFTYTDGRLIVRMAPERFSLTFWLEFKREAENMGWVCIPRRGMEGSTLNMNPR